MKPITPFPEKQHVVILDGGLATELERRGADLRDPLWSAKLLLENPVLIRQVHYDYFLAGADVATSSSYQATIPGLLQRSLDADEAKEILRLSVALARQARADFWRDPAHREGRLEPLVAASVGCYGAALHDGSEYRGDYGLTVQELMAWHRPRLEILADSGADLIACETVPCLAEAESLVRLLADFRGMSAWLSVSCQDERRLCHGELFTEVVALANEAPHIVAVGVNCTAPRFVEGLLESAEMAKKPLLAYPNSGESWDAGRAAWHGADNEVDWPTNVVRWVKAGARLIGGCCRTTPATIRLIRNSFQAAGLFPGNR